VFKIVGLTLLLALVAPARHSRMRPYRSSRATASTSTPGSVSSPPKARCAVGHVLRRRARPLPQSESAKSGGGIILIRTVFTCNDDSGTTAS
jgi:hypothetical protein